MTPTADELRPEIEKVLGLDPKEIFLGFGKDYPECLCMVVLRDVGPAKMDRVCRMIYKRQEKGQDLRLCANIVEKKHGAKFADLDFDAAWRLSWDLNIATVRAE